MSGKKQITEDQHWAPQFYLKNFTNDKGLLEVLDIKNGKLIKAYSPKGVCYKSFFYAKKTGKKDEVSQLLEEAFQIHENEFSNQYKSICDNILTTTQIKKHHVFLLADFISLLWLRSSQFRKQINEAQEKMDKQQMIMRLSGLRDGQKLKIGKQLIGKEACEELINGLKNNEIRIKYDNWLHLMMLKKWPEYTEIFYYKKWRFFIALGDHHFVSSDTPVIEVFPKRIGAYGASINQRTHYFVLNPSILIELSSPHKPGKHVKRKTLFSNKSDDLEKIIDLNIIRVNHSEAFCYSDSKNELQELLNCKN